MPLSVDAARQRVRLNPRDPEFFNNPYPAYRELRAIGSAFFWEDYGFWCLARHADVAQLLRDRRFGRQILHVASRESLGWPEPPEHLEPFTAIEQRSLLELEPPQHTRLRALVNRAFVSRQVERLQPKIEALAHELIDRFAANGEAELISAFATPIPLTVIAEMIGAPIDMADQMLAWSHSMVGMYQFGVTREVEDAAAAAARDFGAFVRTLIGERRRRPKDDLISQLIAAEENGARLSEDEMTTTVILLLNAGHEATVHAIGNGVKALLEAGEIASPNEACVDELLRFDAPLHLFTRYALADLELNGVRLRQGDRVGLLLGAANRDAEAFPDPDRLHLSRRPNPHVAFGAGIHFCVGAPLARLEMRLALPILFQRLPGLRLDGGPRYRDAFHFHGLEALPTGW